MIDTGHHKCNIGQRFKNGTLYKELILEMTDGLLNFIYVCLVPLIELFLSAQRKTQREDVLAKTNILHAKLF